jgi:hypothetical protein
MKNIKYLWMVVLAAVAFPLSDAFAVTCTSGFYPFYCRGRIAIEQIPDANFALISFTFVKHTGAAGSTGQNLPNGTCAWGDRGLYASEPAAMQITWNLAGQGQSAAFDIIRECAGTQSCAFQVCAKGTAYPYLMGYSDGITTH